MVGVACAVVLTGSVAALAARGGGDGPAGTVRVRSGAPSATDEPVHDVSTTSVRSTTTTNASVEQGFASPSSTVPPPWSAEPTTGLVNLQEVTITAYGLPNGPYVVGQCPADIVVPDLNHCVTNGKPSFVTVDDGALSSTVQVFRQLRSVDCASAPGRCAVGFMPNDPKSDFAPVGFPISFDPARPPRITVTPTEGLVDGQTIEVRGIDVGNGVVWVEQCLRDSVGCVRHETVGAADGSFSLSFAVTRDVPQSGRFPTGTGHCGVDDECEIVVSVFRFGTSAWSWNSWATPIALHFAPLPATSTTVGATTSTTGPP